MFVLVTVAVVMAKSNVHLEWSDLLLNVVRAVASLFLVLSVSLFREMRVLVSRPVLLVTFFVLLMTNWVVSVFGEVVVAHSDWMVDAVVLLHSLLILVPVVRIVELAAQLRLEVAGSVLPVV